MAIFSLYIFDRHCSCVYYQDWHRSRRPKPAGPGKLPPAVAQAVEHKPKPSDSLPPITSPRNTLRSSTGFVVALGNDAQPSLNSPLRTSTLPPAAAVPTSALAFDEEAKLVFGVVLSLRNMVKKLSGRDEQFVNLRTSAYKMHLFETLTGYKFIMLSHPSAESLRFHLRQLYAGPFLEYVVRNPLVTMDSKERGIDNDNFRAATDRFVRSLPAYA